MHMNTISDNLDSHTPIGKQCPCYPWLPMIEPRHGIEEMCRMTHSAVNSMNRLLVICRRVTNTRQNAELHQCCQKTIILILFGRVIDNTYKTAPNGRQFAYLGRIRPTNGRFVLCPLLRTADKRPLKANTSNFRAQLTRLALHNRHDTLYLLDRFRPPCGSNSWEKRGDTGTYERARHRCDFLLCARSNVVSMKSMCMNIKIARSDTPGTQITHLNRFLRQPFRT